MKDIPVDFKVKVSAQKHEVDSVNEDLRIDEDNLNSEYTKQPSLFTWYAVMSAESEALRDSLKFELEMLYAQIGKQVRLEIELCGDKVTEKLIDQEIARKEEYRQKKEELLEANRQFNVMKAVKEGLVQKKDMLISLGANLRGEIGSNVKILKEESSDKASKIKSIRKKKKKREMED